MTSGLIPGRNHFDISNIASAILSFFQKKYSSWMVILSTLESSNLIESIKCPPKWFILAKIVQNLEYRYVNLKCDTKPIWFTLNALYSSKFRRHNSNIISMWISKAFEPSIHCSYFMLPSTVSILHFLNFYFLPNKIRD